MVATVQVQIDAGIKDTAARLLDDMGLDQAAAIDLFFRQIIFEGKLPFAPAPKGPPAEIGQAIDGLIAAGKMNVVDLDVNEKGEIIIDKDRHPHLYDWAVSG
ncbi:MAG: type II toxin-antitoxin system RelB/DinJ family antitoxin [Defluviitaleaceae bacterium]|nr:type II toxin-antitoxin system RelB/DinJ family antitoxin [Defluviitaleaceae bacterium]